MVSARLLVSAVGVVVVAGCAVSAPSTGVAACDASAWRFVYANDPSGVAVDGSRDALVEAIRRGSPVRVAWGEAAADDKWAVEEFSNTTFVNVIGRSDVVAQLEPALIQTHYTETARAGLQAPLREWYAIAATDGRLEALIVERRTGEVLRRLVQRTHLYWYVFAPAPSCDDRYRVASAPPGRLNVIEVDERSPAGARRSSSPDTHGK